MKTENILGNWKPSKCHKCALKNECAGAILDDSNISIIYCPQFTPEQKVKK